MEENALDACPFCKSEYITLERDEYGNEYAECLYCGAQGPYKDTTEKARIAWNTRAN